MSLKKELISLEFYTTNIKNEVTRNRISHLLEWYVKKGTYYKRTYYLINIIIVVINASIPIINQLKFSFSLILVSIIAGIASVLASILTLISVKDTWFRYRKHAELLKKECMFFNCHWGIYEDGEREKMLVVKVEEIINDEREYWEVNKINKNQEKKQKSTS
ncbi:DUF4231 domain-containing protein [Bacillus mycoides]|uniref:DUF4231 domain-containing protein n=1 Tax=Bacillus mycoides TaxID=1405 RepID=UPI0013FE28D0|nr:DUF4231 domain-containing protein [Bacillus mycoides]